MLFSRKHGARRAEVRKNRPDNWGTLLRRWKDEGVYVSIGIAAAFCVVAIAIVMLREDVVVYRPGQYVPQDVLSRVSFTFVDKDLLNKAKNDAREAAPHVYAPIPDAWADLKNELLALPHKLAGKRLPTDKAGLAELETTDPELAALQKTLNLSSATLDDFQAANSVPFRDQYARQVADYVADLGELVILSPERFTQETDSPIRQTIAVPGKTSEYAYYSISGQIYPAQGGPEFREQFQKLHGQIDVAAGRHFATNPRVYLNVANLTFARVRPAFELDPRATEDLKNLAADRVRPSQGQQAYSANQPLVYKDNILTEKQWQLLKAEKDAFVRSLGIKALKGKLGMAGTVLLMTVVLAFYIGYFERKVIRNHERAVGIGALLLSMLLLAQLAAIGTGPLYVFGTAPTILVAMILAIAYDQRFAMGVASMHGIIVTAALDQGIGFFLILWVGVLTTCFLLDEVRTRSKLIEVGGAASLAMIAATIAAGATNLDPIAFIAKNCLYTGAAGLAVGFIVLGILPFIEKVFHITTSMTLLELADVCQPLLRRLQLEAPGTYAHSLQVATLAEAAAEAIKSDSLLCRVAAYYHDVGKMNKPDYFVENQVNGENRHHSLNPSLSFNIIAGHVKDGIALAKEYNLPTVIHPFIQQHHGTTLVEYFYHRACHQKDPRRAPNEPEGPTISEYQYRYAGPKPQRKEIAILMLADAVESATRAMSEPNPARIESLIHELAMKRLLDKQFVECDLTMKDLEIVERSLIRTLTGIYHGRIAYPTTKPAPTAPAVAAAAPALGAMRTA